MTTITKDFDPPLHVKPDDKLALKYEVDDIADTIINGILVVLYDHEGRSLFTKEPEFMIEGNTIVLQPILFNDSFVFYSIAVIFY